MNRLFRYSAFFFVLGLYVTESVSAELKKIRMYDADVHVRIVFEATERVEKVIFYKSNPDRLVIDLKNIGPSSDFEVLSLKILPAGIEDIRWSKRGKDFRFVVEAKEKLNYAESALPPAGAYGHRLLVDLPKKFSSAKIPPKSEVGYGNVSIIIDPGHGGEDPGAIGRNNNQEKKIVLELGRLLEKKLNLKLGFSASLTRKRDYYVALHRRLEIAQERGGMRLSLCMPMHSEVGACQAHLSTCSHHLLKGQQVNMRNF